MPPVSVGMIRWKDVAVANLRGACPPQVGAQTRKTGEFSNGTSGENTPGTNKDGSEDVERFRRALFEGRVRTTPSLLLRSAFADAITLVDPAGNHKLARGRSTGRIDAAAATVIAVAQGVRMQGQPESKARMIWA